MLEIATSQLKRTKMTAILLAHHANVTHLKAYPFAALNETPKRSDNPLGDWSDLRFDSFA